VSRRGSYLAGRKCARRESHRRVRKRWRMCLTLSDDISTIKKYVLVHNPYIRLVSCTRVCVPVVLVMRAVLFANELLVHDFLKLDHFGGSVVCIGFGGKGCLSVLIGCEQRWWCCTCRWPKFCKSSSGASSDEPGFSRCGHRITVAF
jgi:hypothetical protein